MAQLKLNSIQVMRGIAALMVVGFHYRTSLNGVYAQANLGDLSYSIYLIHIPVGLFFAKYGSDIPWYPKNPGWAKFLTDLMSAYFLSLIMFNYIEKPSVIIGKKLIEKLRLK